MTQDPLLGAVAGGYRVVSLLSVGGMGSVYRAEHALIGRPAAIKVLLPEMSMNRDMVQRFFNEAKATTAIKHPGIVEVFDFGYLPSGQAYIVMELLDGMTLAQRVRVQGRMHEGEAAMILRSVCGALAAAHATGVVHRDLKPDNIFLIPDPEAPIGVRCKLLDFGIAKLTAMGAATSTTKTGAVMGTPTYMSPEQCKGSGDVDARADLYALGCIFYELVAGRPPFVCEGAGELLGSHLFVEPQPPSQLTAGISLEAETLILQLLAKLPGRRVQSARELAARVTALAQAHGWAVSSTDLDARMSMTSVPYAGNAPAEESTQLAPLPTPDPDTIPPPMSFAGASHPNEDTQPIAMPLPANDAIRSLVPPRAAIAASVTTPMAVPTGAGRQTKPMPTPMLPPMGGAALSGPMPMPLPPRVAAPAMPTPMPMPPYVPTPMPMPAYARTPPPLAAYVPTPTTLSGAAREAQAMGPPPRKLRAGRIVLALVVAGAAVGAIVFFALGGADGGPRAATLPVPAPVPALVTPPPPNPVAPAVVIDAAVAPAVVIDAAVAPAPAIDAPVAPAPAIDAAITPAIAIDAAIAPDAAVAKPAKPTPAKPTQTAPSRPTRPTSSKPPSPDTELLEPKL